MKKRHKYALLFSFTDRQTNLALSGLRAMIETLAIWDGEQWDRVCSACSQSHLNNEREECTFALVERNAALMIFVDCAGSYEWCSSFDTLVAI